MTQPVHRRLPAGPILTWQELARTSMGGELRRPFADVPMCLPIKP